MISIETQQDKNGNIRAFTARNHGVSHVCAAVSLFVINTVNSIEKFLDTDFKTAYKENGGYIKFKLTGETDSGEKLLLDAMMLGLYSIRDRYPDEIEIIERK